METVIKGWDNIAKFFGVSSRSIFRRRKELLEAGVVFYMWQGKPRHRVAAAFPSVLKAWISRKAVKGEMF